MEITVLTLPHLQIFQDKQKNLIFKNVSQFNKNHSVGQIEKFVGSLSYLFFFSTAATRDGPEILFQIQGQQMGRG